MADPTDASTVRAIRRAGAAGEPVSAEVAAAWAKALMEQLYGMQKPVRYECRRRGTNDPWEEAEPADVTHPSRRSLVIRALYLHPPVGRQEHRWPPGSNGDGRCLDCDEAEWLAGPDCRPHAPLRDHRSAMPFRLAWLIQPLEQLHHLAKNLNPTDRAKWRNEATYLIDRIRDHEKARQP